VDALWRDGAGLWLGSRRGGLFLLEGADATGPGRALPLLLRPSVKAHTLVGSGGRLWAAADLLVAARDVDGEVLARDLAALIRLG
jgi:hypothetical protein